jgi:hypothetical protein
MENRVSLDKEVDVPIGLIDPAPWNPKVDISGVYERGLGESIYEFGVRDRMKIWPNPKLLGRFICLNGNQRIGLIKRELLNQQLKLALKLDENCSEPDFEAAKADPKNAAKVRKVERDIPKWPVPVQIMSKLDKDTPLSENDAKLFTLSFDRNHARYDDVKLSEGFREVLAERLRVQGETTRKIIESKMKAMVRPELPFNPPKQADPAAQSNFQFAEPGEFQPTEAEPWGPSPPESSATPAPATDKSGKPIEQLIPMVFSITVDGYKEINDLIMRSKSRVFREHKLKSALEKLSKLTPDNFSDKLDSIIVELALLLTNKHIEAEKSNA